MNIIFVSNNMSKAKTLSLLQVSIITLVLIFLPIFIALILIVPQDSGVQQGVKSLIPSQLKFSFINPQKHLDAYAVQLGEMQARIMRLDAQSERLAKLAGEKKYVHENSIGSKQEATKLLSPNQGGPLILSAPLSELDLQKNIAELMAHIDFETDHLSDLEAKLLQQSVLKGTLPNSSPVDVAYNSSSYGWRIDPFTGSKAFHEGLDFTAEVGTPIRAAADGIVTEADRTTDYGNIVKVDHGSGLETRYAHASKILVKVGDRVVKGQILAEVGSTGRSTGPHLHYEIRLDGNPLDPRKYLKASS